MELAGAAWATGFRSLFNKSFGQTLNDVKAVLYSKDKEASQFSNELMSMGFLQDWLHTHGSVRYADTDQYFNLSKAEHKLMGMTEGLFKYNGMKAITGMLEQMVASNAIHDVIRMGKKQRFTKAELDRLSRWGIEKDELATLGKYFEDTMTFEGDRLVAMNVNKMNKTAQDKLQTMVSRAVRSGVLKNDTMQLPSWMIIPTPMRKLATQFMRFPMMAHQILLRRGLEEDMAGLTATALAGMFMYGSYTYLREQAAIASGLQSEDKSKYDVFGDKGSEAAINLVTKSLSYTAPLGAFSLGASFVKDISGLGYNDSPGALAVGPVASNLDSAQQFMRAAISGEDVGYKGAKLLQRNMPYFTFPFFQEALNSVVEETR
jgi:hypothetical protein